MSTIKIVSGVIDEERLTLITATGEKITVEQGDKRLRPILDYITAPITTHGEVDMPAELLEQIKDDPMPFAEFEQASEGHVSFFRVAKKTVGRWIRALTGKTESRDVERAEEMGEHVSPMVIQGTKVVSEEEAVSTKQAAIQEIMSKAVPAKDPSFESERIERQKPVQEDGNTPNDRVETDAVSRMINDEKSDTVVAIVDGEIIPGMEMIESQFKHALKFGSHKGVVALLKRLGAVIQKRGHAIDDVLRFMQRGDMRVDDKGNIIALKALKLASNYGKKSDVEDAPKEQYVDAASKNVLQWVGSVVQMAESLVDHNRGQECSSGLHIARRGYLTGSGFGGDVCVLVLLAPEDVIAVPYYDANKVRACRYHIVAKLTNEMFDLIKKNKPITDCAAGKTLLANVTAGNHIEVTHISEIHGSHGDGLVVTKVNKASKVVLDQEMTLEALPDTVLTARVKDEPVSPVAAQATINLSRKEVAKGLYDAWVASYGYPGTEAAALNELLLYKKQAKISWDKLGIPNNGTDPIIMASMDPGSPEGDQTVTVTGPDAHQQLVNTVADIVTKMAKTKASITKKSLAKTTPKPKIAKKVPAFKPPKVDAPAPAKAPQKPTKAKKTMTAPTPSPKKKTTPREDMATLLGNKKPEDITSSIARSAQSIKQAAKKSWSVLGLSPEMERAVKKKLDAGKW